MITRRPVLAGLGGAAVFGTKAMAADDTRFVGDWTGVLDAGAQLRLRLVIGADRTVVLISLDQNNAKIPCQLTSMSDGRIAFSAPAVRGRFEGRLVDADRIEGAWTQRGTLPLVFQRGDAGLATAPAAPLTTDMLADLRRSAGSPALAAGSIARNGAPRLWVDGERRVGSGVAATISDQWHVGSITKSFTATLVARLVEAGAVQWDTTVGEVLGAAAPQMRAEYRGATFLHLLSHRAGLQANIPMGQVGQYSRATPDARAERVKLAQTALSMAPKGPAGETFEYSNNGYVIAGAMLEARLSERWEDLLRRYVLDPLGLTSAGFGAPGVAGRLDQPVGHAKKLLGEDRKAFPLGEGLTDNPVVLGPAGTLHMTLANLLTYACAHRDATAPFLTADSWRTLHTPPFGGDYALGWVVRPDKSLWHNGSNTLWYAEVMFDPATGVVAAAVCNDGFIEKSGPAVGRALSSAAAAAA